MNRLDLTAIAVHPPGERVFFCHVCALWASYSEGGDGCAASDDDECPHDPPCFYVCATCWWTRERGQPDHDPRRPPLLPVLWLLPPCPGDTSGGAA